MEVVQKHEIPEIFFFLRYERLNQPQLSVEVSHQEGENADAGVNRRQRRPFF